MGAPATSMTQNGGACLDTDHLKDYDAGTKTTNLLLSKSEPSIYIEQQKPLGSGRRAAIRNASATLLRFYVPQLTPQSPCTMELGNHLATN